VRPPYSGLRSGASSPIVLGRKFCPSCGRWRPVHDFKLAPRRANGFYPYCYPCDRACHRAVRERRLKDPVRAELHREYNRIWSEAKRRRRGARARARPTVVDRAEYVFLPREPLIAQINGYNAEEVARRTGVPARSVLRILSGESRAVRLDLADKIAIGLGVSLFEIYGDRPLLRGKDRQVLR
jgi:transcriptional regulator with XRE-family HTH domain